MTSHDRFRIAALLLAIVVLPAITWSQSQNRDPNISSESALDRWIDWKPFLGTWEGTGTGEPGQSELNFTFEKELQGFVLTCHSYAEYPASKDKPAHRHDDLMVIYPSPSGKNTRADYWGNEGHVIHYDVNLSLGKLVFLSDVNQPGPRFRLTY